MREAFTEQRSYISLHRSKFYRRYALRLNAFFYTLIPTPYSKM